jgi:hypothetical protein
VILCGSCARRDSVKMAGEPSAVEVGSYTASRDLLRMQLTMCVLEICPLNPTLLRGSVPRLIWDFISGSFPSYYPLPRENAYIFKSVNGCSLKTEENLAAVKVIDLQRIMFETGTSRYPMSPSPAQIKYKRCPMVFHDLHTCVTEVC